MQQIIIQKCQYKLGVKGRCHRLGLNFKEGFHLCPLAETASSSSTWTGAGSTAGGLRAKGCAAAPDRMELGLRGPPRSAEGV